MNIRSLASGLLCRGEVKAKRQTYYVFEGKRHFFVMSLSRSKHNAGNFNLVNVGGVEYIARRFGGQQDVTAKALLKNCRKPQYVSSTFDALNILYVLARTIHQSSEEGDAGGALLGCGLNLGEWAGDRGV